MTREEQRELLVAFGDWLHPRIGLEVWHREIDAFLASRAPAPPATEQRYWRFIDAESADDHCTLEIVNARGKLLERPTYYPSSARVEAISDGRASGLQEWKP